MKVYEIQVDDALAFDLHNDHIDVQSVCARALRKELRKTRRGDDYSALKGHLDDMKDSTSAIERIFERAGWK